MNLHWEIIESRPSGMTYRALQAVARANAEKRRRIAEEADFCVNWLRAQGLEVLAVSDGPRITIRCSPLCEQFEGAVNGYSRGQNGVERYKEVIRMDCAIRWRVMGFLGDDRDGRAHDE